MDMYFLGLCTEKETNLVPTLPSNIKNVACK